MERKLIDVVKMRVTDVMVGDVINKDPESTSGWFAVHELQQLPSGEINAVGATSKLSIVAGPYDIVGVQIQETLQVSVAPPAIPHVA